MTNNAHIIDTLNTSAASHERDQTAASAPRRQNRYRVVAITFLCLGVVGYAAVTYFGFDPSSSNVGLRPNIPWQYPLLMTHILTASVALTLGPLQFVRRIRRHQRLHRYIGRAYLFAGVFPASIAGFGVALLATGGPIAAAGLAVGDILWMVTAIAGYRAARAKRYREHADWMIRNFALTFSAVSFRIWLPLLILVQVPLLDSFYNSNFRVLFNHAYSATAWLAFIPNLLFINSYLKRRQHRSVPNDPAGLAAGGQIGRSQEISTS
ncbi:MAG: DUF2306 domain-containing protein [Antricoccus sp.]